MNLIKRLLNEKKQLIPYFTYGDPKVHFTEALVSKCFDSGIDIIELGLPFSDPIADGPVIQASHHRALENNPELNILDALKMVARLKTKHPKKALIFMGSVNLVLNYGVKKFFIDAKKHKLDGIIIPDLPPEEGEIYITNAKNNSIDLIFLASPLTSDKRLKVIAKASSGFVYLISSTGTTGARSSISKDLARFVKKIKSYKDIPVAVGFGISKKEHLDLVFGFADGGIVGSLLVDKISDSCKSKDAQIKIIQQTINYIQNG
jgi:tryptophan synthase alpha subunit